MSLDKAANIDTYVCFEGSNIKRNRKVYSGLSDGRLLNFLFKRVSDVFTQEKCKGKEMGYWPHLVSGDTAYTGTWLDPAVFKSLFGSGCCCQ